MLKKKRFMKKGVGRVILAALCLGLCACGKKEEKSGVSRWDSFNIIGCMEDGVLYPDYDANLMRYLDCETREHYPLCARPNCLHDSPECTAVYFRGNASFMGRIGEKWYYYQHGDTEENFRSCDLDGGNDKVLKSFPYDEESVSSFSDTFGTVLFREDGCFASMGKSNWEEDPAIPDSFYGASLTGAIYRFDLKTGEREALCEEKTTGFPPYVLIGSYKDSLIYSECLTDGSMEMTFRKLDLRTGESSDLGASCIGFGGYVNQNFLVFNEPDGEGTKLVEYDLDTGEKTAVFEEAASVGVWEAELKTFLVIDSSEEQEHRVYRYTKEGGCDLLYESSFFCPQAAYGDLLVGINEEWKRAYMSREDFLAGMENWTMIEGE